MIKVIAGDRCRELGGIMPPQMNCDDKLKNCEAIVKAGKYKDITIATFDPMVIEGIDIYKDVENVHVRYFLNEKEIPENHLCVIYNDLGRIYDDIDSLKIMLRYRGCCDC